MSLAAKLPWNHRFAGGFPGLSSQPLPTDADAIDYLTRMATADGAGVEVGVATAVDAFFRDTKESGVFSALKACCILAGARTLAGALVPVVGDAPTAYGFVEGDYNRQGLKGDGTSYLNTNRSALIDPQNDFHLGGYSTTDSTFGGYIVAVGSGAVGAASRIGVGATGYNNQTARTNTGYSFPAAPGVGFIGVSRDSSSSFFARNNSAEYEVASASASSPNETFMAFARTNGAGAAAAIGNHGASFYSIGTSLSLEDLDTAVTNLITAIGNAI